MGPALLLLLFILFYQKKGEIMLLLTIVVQVWMILLLASIISLLWIIFRPYSGEMAYLEQMMTFFAWLIINLIMWLIYFIIN